MSVRTIALQDARAAMIGAQFPGGSEPGSLVERTGFVRTLGGVDAYVALRARLPAIRRAEIDAAVVRRELAVVPAVRGCIYLVGERDVDVCLSVAKRQTAVRTAREHEGAGIAPQELATLGDTIVEALGRGPLTVDQLRRALPDGAVRKLGVEVKRKLGLSSTMGPALRQLELERRIERTFESGRLDTERYTWRATGHTARADGDDVAANNARLAEIFFASAPIAALSELAEWAGISQTDAKAAIAGLDLEPVDIDDEGRFLASARWRDHAARGRDAVAFLPFEDNVAALHGGVAVLVDAAHHRIPVPMLGGGGRLVELGEAKHMMLRFFVADGRIAGLWEYDPDRVEVVFAWFSPPSGAAQARLRDLAYATTSFIHGELGHAHAASIDSDDALRERVAFVREVGGAPRPVAPAAKAPTRARTRPGKRKPTGERIAGGRRGKAAARRRA